MIAKKQNKKLCRYCDVAFEDAGSPQFDASAVTTNVASVRNLRNQNTKESSEKLNDLGYKPFHDGMVDCHFSDPILALHGATPGEVLHAFNMGMAERTINFCYASKVQLKIETKRKRVEEADQGSKKRKLKGGKQKHDDSTQEGKNGEVDEKDDMELDQRFLGEFSSAN